MGINSPVQFLIFPIITFEFDPFSPQMIVPNATDSSEDALDCALNLFSSPDKAGNHRDPSFIRCYNSKNAKG